MTELKKEDQGSFSPESENTHRAVDGGRVIRDGKVAVLVSPGYGAGWYSWNSDCRPLLFDPAIVEAVEAGDKSRAVARAEELCPDGYFGGADDLRVEWLEPGTLFRIDEYDGSESLVLSGDDSWVTA